MPESITNFYNWYTRPEIANIVVPLCILLIGTFIAIYMIVRLKVGAFIALICAAIYVSISAPGTWDIKMVRVAESFGVTCGKVGIIIAMASVIGACMMASGAADKIIQSFLKALGQKNASLALLSSGYLLSVPVFFDTVFFLLIPLAKSMYRSTKKNYLLYILAIGAGGVITHTLVPPTPGPIAVAKELNVDMGVMILIGGLVGIPCAFIGLMYAGICNKYGKLEYDPLDLDVAAPTQLAGETARKKTPSLFVSLSPIILPLVLISINTVIKAILDTAPTNQPYITYIVSIAGYPLCDLVEVGAYMSFFGDPNFAIILSTFVSLAIYAAHCKPTKAEFTGLIDSNLMTGAAIIIITAAGGAFGAMLKEAQVGDAIKLLAAHLTGDEKFPPYVVVLLGFGIASMFKIAQGSSTVAMITTASMMAGILSSIEGDIGFHLVYLCIAIGSGALCCSWMNDSGFWVVSKMSGMKEGETLKYWTAMLMLMGLTGLGVTLLMVTFLPDPFFFMSYFSAPAK